MYKNGQTSFLIVEIYLLFSQKKKTKYLPKTIFGHSLLENTYEILLKLLTSRQNLKLYHLLFKTDENNLYMLSRVINRKLVLK